MQHRFTDIEGSLFASVRDKLEECVVDKEIYYVPSLFTKKGVIKKAEFINNKLLIYVSNGAYSYSVLLFLCGIMLIIVLYNVVN